MSDVKDAVAREIDAARLPVMLNTLRLPTIGKIWTQFAAQADREGWGAGRFLAALCEHELADRDQRRIARHLRESELPQGKTFATFDFAAVPSVRKAQLTALAESDSWLDQGANLLCFGPSGVGKTHAAAAIGYALIERGRWVFFSRTTDIVQRLQAARRDLSLPSLLAKLDRFDALVLDDLGYARKDQAETAVLFELIAERYERRSLIVTCNQPFGEWDKIFPEGRALSATHRRRPLASARGCRRSVRLSEFSRSLDQPTPRRPQGHAHMGRPQLRPRSLRHRENSESHHIRNPPLQRRLQIQARSVTAAGHANCRRPVMKIVVAH